MKSIDKITIFRHIGKKYTYFLAISYPYLQSKIKYDNIAIKFRLYTIFILIDYCERKVGMKKKFNKVTVLYSAVVITTLVYIFWRAFFTIPFHLGITSCIFGLLLFLSETLGAIETIQHCYGMGEELVPDLPQIDKHDYPDIDVFIATYNEPCELLYKTINGCLYMKYPDKNKVHIYILDDGNRSEIRELAATMKVGYITRTKHLHAKAGNLNNALQHTSSPLVATFDADMIPLSDFLLKTVPYFLLPQYQCIDGNWIKKEANKHLKIGFIQSPQCFYNPDLFQYNLFSEDGVPNEQDYFYRDVQIARNKTNSAIYGGSNTVISREALEQIGGFFTGVITEDFATGISIQAKGYTCYAIKDVLAVGLSPTDLKSLINQRARWARGCIQTLRKVKIITRKGLSIGQKISYCSSLLYWYTPLRRLMYILAPILFAVFGIQVVKCSFIDLLIWWLPQYLVYQYAIKQFSKNIRTNRLSNIYDTILFPSLLPAVILETFGISQKKFAVTNKEKVDNAFWYQCKHSLIHILLFVLSIFSLMNCIQEIFFGDGNTYFIVFFWTLVNLYSLSMAIFFMMGRKFFRVAERFQIEMPLYVEGIHHPCITKDISDGGLSFVCDFPYYLPTNRALTFTLDTVQFKGMIKHVALFGKQWKYGVEIVAIEEKMKQEYFHIIYDREPTLPDTISKNHSFFDELSYNIIRRMNKSITYNRKLPRLEVNQPLKTKDKEVVICKNFNYEYILLEGPVLKERLELIINETISLTCKKQSNYRGGALYKVDNHERLINNPQFLSIISEWSKTHFINMEKQKINIPKEDKIFDERLYYEK